MAGTPLFNGYGGGPTLTQGAGRASGSASHTSFLVWLVIIGVIVPVAILGGLKISGFSFVLVFSSGAPGKSTRKPHLGEENSSQAGSWPAARLQNNRAAKGVTK